MRRVVSWSEESKEGGVGRGVEVVGGCTPPVDDRVGLRLHEIPSYSAASLHSCPIRKGGLQCSVYSVLDVGRANVRSFFSLCICS